MADSIPLPLVDYNTDSVELTHQFHDVLLRAEAVVRYNYFHLRMLEPFSGLKSYRRLNAPFVRGYLNSSGALTKKFHRHAVRSMEELYSRAMIFVVNKDKLMPKYEALKKELKEVDAEVSRARKRSAGRKSRMLVKVGEGRIKKRLYRKWFFRDKKRRMLHVEHPAAYRRRFLTKFYLGKVLTAEDVEQFLEVLP